MDGWTLAAAALRKIGITSNTLPEASHLQPLPSSVLTKHIKNKLASNVSPESCHVLDWRGVEGGGRAKYSLEADPRVALIKDLPGCGCMVGG